MSARTSTSPTRGSVTFEVTSDPGGWFAEFPTPVGLGLTGRIVRIVLDSSTGTNLTATVMLFNGDFARLDDDSVSNIVASVPSGDSDYTLVTDIRDGEMVCRVDSTVFAGGRTEATAGQANTGRTASDLDLLLRGGDEASYDARGAHGMLCVGLHVSAFTAGGTITVTFYSDDSN